MRSLHPQVKEHPGRKPLADIKLMKEDAEGAEKASEEIKARYQKLFKVMKAIDADAAVATQPTGAAERHHDLVAGWPIPGRC